MNNDLQLIKELFEEKLSGISDRFDTLHSDVRQLKETVDKVEYTINNVAANGRLGLNESFRDIYAEIKSVKESVNKHQEYHDSSIMNMSIHKLLFSNKTGKFVSFILLLLLLNSSIILASNNTQTVLSILQKLWTIL